MELHWEGSAPAACTVGLFCGLSAFYHYARNIAAPTVQMFLFRIKNKHTNTKNVEVKYFVLYMVDSLLYRPMIALEKCEKRKSKKGNQRITL